MVCVGDLSDLVPAIAPEHAVIQGHEGAVCDEPGLVVLGPVDWAVSLSASKPTGVVCTGVALSQV